MPEIDVIVDNCSGRNKNNVTTLFMNIINEVGFFEAATFYLYIRDHTNNDCDHASNSFKAL